MDGWMHALVQQNDRGGISFLVGPHHTLSHSFFLHSFFGISLSLVDLVQHIATTSHQRYGESLVVVVTTVLCSVVVIVVVSFVCCRSIRSQQTSRQHWDDWSCGSWQNDSNASHYQSLERKGMVRKHVVRRHWQGTGRKGPQNHHQHIPHWIRNRKPSLRTHWLVSTHTQERERERENEHKRERTIVICCNSHTHTC